MTSVDKKLWHCLSALFIMPVTVEPCGWLTASRLKLPQVKKINSVYLAGAFDVAVTSSTYGFIRSNWQL